MSLLDLLGEAMEGLLRRPVRTILTSLGIVVGVAVIVATSSMAASAALAVESQFERLRPTEFRVELGEGGGTDVEWQWLEEGEVQLAALNGVVAAGVIFRYRADAPAQTLRRPDVRPRIVPLVAASSNGLRALGTEVGRGSLYGSFHEANAARVAVLDAAVARDLGVHDVGRAVVYIQDTPLIVMGVLDDSAEASDYGGAVFVPPSTARSLVAMDSEAVPGFLVRADADAMDRAAAEAPFALRPDAPTAFTVSRSPDPQGLRTAVRSEVVGLSLVLAAVSMIVAAVGIGASSLLSVLERTREFGLRRAMGASRAHISLQILAEGATCAAAASLVGSVSGVGVAQALAASRGWQPVVGGWLLGAPILGIFVGCVAALLPAIRAGRIQPLDALRRA